MHLKYFLANGQWTINIFGQNFSSKISINFKSLITDESLEYAALNSGIFPINFGSRLMGENNSMSMTTQTIYM